MFYNKSVLNLRCSSLEPSFGTSLFSENIHYCSLFSYLLNIHYFLISLLIIALLIFPGPVDIKIYHYLMRIRNKTVITMIDPVN